MAQLCERLRKQAIESDVPLIDLHQPFLTPTRTTRTDLYLPDGLHPNLKGQDVIAKAVSAGFQQYFNFHL